MEMGTHWDSPSIETGKSEDFGMRDNWPKIFRAAEANRIRPSHDVLRPSPARLFFPD